jgi:hypothetical protein
LKEKRKARIGMIEMIERIYKNKYMAICDNCGTGQECEGGVD